MASWRERAGGRRAGAPALVLAAAASAALLASAAAGAVTDAAMGGAGQLSATAAPAELALGARVTVGGRLLDGTGAPAPGVVLTLQADPYPYRGFATATTTTSASDGSYAFAPLRPTVDTRLRVLAGGAFAATAVAVDPRVALTSRTLGPGRTLLSVRIRHAPAAGPDGTAWWYVRVPGAKAWELAADGAASEIAPGLLAASAVVDPPARRFSFRVCVNPAWEASMGPPAAHGSCPHSGFVLPGDAR